MDLGPAAVVDDARRLREIERQLILLSRSSILIGFQDGDVTQAESKNGRFKQPGLSMAQIAAENEFGTQIIPARPFMSTSFDENLPRIQKVIDVQYRRILSGKLKTQRALDIIGLFMVRLVVEKINQIQTPPNSPRTILAKKSSKPLIDFGQMRASVRYTTQVT